MIIVYITCESKNQAYKIGEYLLRKRLSACVNIFENMTSISWWPPKKNQLAKDKEVVLIVKTIEKKFKEIEKEVIKIHSYETPCVFSIKVDKASKSYLNWLRGEIR